MGVAWTKIDRPHLHGYVAHNGTRTVEIVRAYTSDWREYRYVNSEMLRGPYGQDGAFASVRASAAHWLKGQA